MILYQALSKNAEGNLEIDMKMLRQMANAYDEGADNDEYLLAKFIIAAFEAGFDAGLEQCEDNHRKMALLMMCTGGHA